MNTQDETEQGVELPLCGCVAKGTGCWGKEAADYGGVTCEREQAGTYGVCSPNLEHIEPLAKVAANLIRSAYDQGYVLGFRAGKNAGLDLALEVINRPKPFVPKHPDDGRPF